MKLCSVEKKISADARAKWPAGCLNRQPSSGKSMVESLLITSFFLMILSIILSLYFHYRVHYLMLFKIMPLLKQQGIRYGGIFPLRYKKNLLAYEELCCKTELHADFSVSVRNNEKRSWIFLIISSFSCIVFLILNTF